MKYLLQFFLLVLFPVSTSAQHFLPTDVPTPNIGNLGHYDDVSVSSYTGAANISIPIYSSEIHDVPINISLNYDTSGVLMNTLPSWTGHNWNLSVGGAITRIANGRYDEYVYPKAAILTYGTHNYFESYFKLRVPQYSVVTSQLDTYNDDMAPDLFVFNFMGHHGSFFLDNNANWVVSSDENLEVIFDINDDDNFILPLFENFPDKYAADKQPRTIKGFTIKTSDGTSYVFGGSADYIEYTTEFFHMGDAENEHSWIANSWYLSKVINKYGSELFTFNYRRGKFLAQFHNAFEENTVHEKDTWMGLSYGQDFTTCNNEFPYSVTLNSPIYLSNILLANGVRITFHSQDISPDSLNWRDVYSRIFELMPYITQCKSMRSHDYKYTYLQNPIYSSYQGFPNDAKENPITACRLRELNYIYINIPEGNRDNYRYFVFKYSFKNRMHITDISVHNEKFNYDKNHSLVGKYSLHYNKIDELPTDYLTDCVDHWGYYKGSATTSLGKNDYKTNHDPNTSYLGYGMLTDIIYPTGGVLSLEYEPNDFSKYVSPDRTNLVDSCSIGGGLRVRRVSHYEDSAKDKILSYKEYSYSSPSNNKSSGQLYNKPQYYWKHHVKYNSQGDKITSYYTTFRHSSIAPLSNSFGPAVGYSYVTESNYIWDSSTDKLINDKKITYNFTNMSDYKDQGYVVRSENEFNLPYDKFSDLSYKRGKLKELSICDSLGNIVARTTYDYWNNEHTAYSSDMVLISYGNSASFCHYAGGILKIYAGKFLLSKECKYIYYNSSMQETINETCWSEMSFYKPQKKDTGTITYFCLPTSKIFRRNEMNEKTEYKYAIKKSMNDIPEGTEGLVKEMFDLTPISTTSYVNGNLVRTTKTLYKPLNSSTRLVVPEYEVMTYNTGVSDTLVSYLSYSSTGSLLKYRVKGEPETYLVWGLNNCYLFAKHYGGPCSFLDFPSIKHFDPKAVQDYFNKQRTIYGNSFDCTNYSYNPLFGMVSMTTPNNYTTYYEYDPLYHNLSKVLDTNKQTIMRYEYNYRKE